MNADSELTFEALPCWPFFPNAENWQIDNWQIATDMLIAIIMAQRGLTPEV